MTYKGIINISHNKVERGFKLLNGDVGYGGLVQNRLSLFYLTQLCIGQTIMWLMEEPSMLLMLAL